MSEAASSADVQREAEQERAELVSTLDKLRENLRPENVVDEVMANARISATDISNRLWQTARRNPIPAVLIGLGAVMLLGVGTKVGKGIGAAEGAARDRSPVTRRPTKPDDRVVGRPNTNPGSVQDRILGELDAVGTRAAASASRISKSARRLKDQASQTTDAMTSSAWRGRSPTSSESDMSTYRTKRRTVTSSLSNLLEEQPLVLAALGVAVGAAIGAALPTTDVESHLMGDANGSVRQSAQELAQEQYQLLKAKAGETLEDIKKTAAERGVSTENFTGLVHDVGGKVRDAAYDVADSAAGKV